MKTLDALMTAHINRSVTTLTTCFTVTRTDGIILRLTAHDQDISFGGNTYNASSGISRSAIKNSADLAVDNLNVLGILSLAVPESELLGGLFDFAQIEIFSVNWVEPDRYGAIIHRTGVLGEVRLNDDGYEAELRGLTQLLSRRRGSVYQPRCRFDLFSPLQDPLTGNVGCGLDSDNFIETGKVLTVTSRRQFGIPAGVVVENSVPESLVEQRGVVVSATGAVTLLPDIEDGSPNRSIGIASTAEFNAIRNDPYAAYHLENDLDFGAFGAWTPHFFYGTLDGRGYAIRNLTSSVGAATGGLFNILVGEVRNLCLHDCSFTNTSGSYIGAICGVLRSGTTTVLQRGQGLIENCSALGCIVDGGGDRAGGLIGLSGNDAIVRDCHGSVEIQGAAGTNVGSFIGNESEGFVAERVYMNSDTTSTVSILTGGGTPSTLNAAAYLDDTEWTVMANYVGYDFVDDWIQAQGVYVDGGASLVFVAASNLVGRTAGDFWAEGFRIRDKITITGTTSNNFTGIITDLSATAMIIEPGLVVDEGPIAGAGVSILGTGSPRILDPGRF